MAEGTQHKLDRVRRPRGQVDAPASAGGDLLRDQCQLALLPSDSFLVVGIADYQIHGFARTPIVRKGRDRA